MNAPVDSFLKAHAAVGFGTPFQGALVGTLLALDAVTGEPLVTFPGRRGTAAVRARSVVALCGADVGRHAVLLFDAGDPTRPLLMGLLQALSDAPRCDQPGTLQVEGDGQRLAICAADRLVLRCGRASLTLTASGTVLLEGTYVVSRASGTNRIQGGAVQIN